MAFSAMSSVKYSLSCQTSSLFSQRSCVGIDAGAGSVGSPVVDVGVEVDAAGEETEPVIEAVRVRSAFVGES